MSALALMPLQARKRSIQATSAPSSIQVQSPPPLREDESLGGEAFRSIDRMREALSATATGGVSPAALTLAFFDWSVHLASAPGKQLELANKAARKRFAY